MTTKPGISLYYDLKKIFCSRCRVYLKRDDPSVSYNNARKVPIHECGNLCRERPLTSYGKHRVKYDERRQVKRIE